MAQISEMQICISSWASSLFAVQLISKGGSSPSLHQDPLSLSLTYTAPLRTTNTEQSHFLVDFTSLGSFQLTNPFHLLFKADGGSGSGASRWGCQDLLRPQDQSLILKPVS